MDLELKLVYEATSFFMWNHFASKYSTHEENFNVCIPKPFLALRVGKKWPANVPAVFCLLDPFDFSFNGKSEANIMVEFGL